MNEHPEDSLYDGGASPEPQPDGSADSAKKPPTKLESVSALGKNPRTLRVILATLGVVLLFGAVAGVTIVSRNRHSHEPSPAALTGAAVGPAPTGFVESTDPTLSDSPRYQGIVDAAGKQRAADALAAGQSAQPLAVTVESSLKPAPTPAEQAASAAEAARVRQPADAGERARTAVLAAQQPPPGYAGSGQPQQPDPAYQQMMTNAQSAMGALLANRTRGAAVFSMVEQQHQGANGGMQQVGYQQGNAQPQVGTQVTPTAASTAPPTAAAATQNQYTLISAGEILSARIDTGINTDVGSEFGATLLTGKYAGAKLIGTYQRTGELAVGSVRLLSLPAQGVSVPATAVILDAESAEAGTASDVDRKLLVRYGIKPLAAGFAAVGEYLKNVGTTVIVNGSTVTTSTPELSNQRIGQIIASNAAQQVNNDANALNTTPTVRVSRGTIVGVFFTQDVLYTPKR